MKMLIYSIFHNLRFYCSYALCLGLFVVSSCSPLIIRRAHVIATYGNQALISAHPEFVGAGPRRYIDDPRFARPKLYGVESMKDGSIVITWISKKNLREKLVLLESGFHPMPIPSQAITELRPPDEQWNDRKSLQAVTPYPIIFDNNQNTAFALDVLKLAPIMGKRSP